MFRASTGKIKESPESAQCAKILFNEADSHTKLGEVGSPGK